MDKNLKATDVDEMVTDCEAKVRTVVQQFMRFYPRLLNAFVDDFQIRISNALSDATSNPNQIVSIENEIVISDDDDDNNQTKVKSETVQLAKIHPPMISLDDDHVDRINTKDPSVQHITNTETRANDIGENQTIVLDEAEFSHTENKVKDVFVENIMNKQPLPNIVKVTNKNQPSCSDDTVDSHKNNSEIDEDVKIMYNNGTNANYRTETASKSNKRKAAHSVRRSRRCKSEEFLGFSTEDEKRSKRSFQFMNRNLKK